MKLQSFLENLPAEAASEAGVSRAIGDGGVYSEDTEQFAPSRNSAGAIEEQADEGEKTTTRTNAPTTASVESPT